MQKEAVPSIRRTAVSQKLTQSSDSQASPSSDLTCRLYHMTPSASNRDLHNSRVIFSSQRVQRCALSKWLFCEIITWASDLLRRAVLEYLSCHWKHFFLSISTVKSRNSKRENSNPSQHSQFLWFSFLLDDFVTISTDLKNGCVH